MSAVNGDKARFNRQRKQKIAHRKRTHDLLKKELLEKELLGKELLGKATTQSKPANASSRDKPHSVPA
jgi:hypothetical protein